MINRASLHLFFAALLIFCYSCGNNNVDLQNKFDVRVSNGTPNKLCYNISRDTNTVSLSFPLIYDSNGNLALEEIRDIKKRVIGEFLQENLILFRAIDTDRREEVYRQILEYDILQAEADKLSPWQVKIALLPENLKECKGTLAIRVESVRKSDFTKSDLLFSKLIEPCFQNNGDGDQKNDEPGKFLPLPELLTDNVETTAPERIKIKAKDGRECIAYRRRMLIRNLELAKFLEKGELIFSAGYFIEKKLFDEKSSERQAIAKIATDVGTYYNREGKDRYVYLFITGSADNNVSNGKATLRKVDRFSDLEKIIFKVPLYTYRLTGNTLEIDAAAYVTNNDGCSNQDLPNLRSSFVRYTLTETSDNIIDIPFFGINHEVADEVVPVGIINGAIDPRKGSAYRTISIYVFESQCPIMERNIYPVDFMRYFK